MQHNTTKPRLVQNTQAAFYTTEAELAPLRRQLSRAEAQRAAQAQRSSNTTNRVRAITSGPGVSEGTHSAQRILRSVSLAGDPLRLDSGAPPQLHRVNTATLNGSRAVHIIAGEHEQQQMRDRNAARAARRHREEARMLQQEAEERRAAWYVGGVYIAIAFCIAAILMTVR